MVAQTGNIYVSDFWQRIGNGNVVVAKFFNVCHEETVGVGALDKKRDKAYEAACQYKTVEVRDIGRWRTKPPVAVDKIAQRSRRKNNRGAFVTYDFVLRPYKVMRLNT